MFGKIHSESIRDRPISENNAKEMPGVGNASGQTECHVNLDELNPLSATTSKAARVCAASTRMSSAKRDPQDSTTSRIRAAKSSKPGKMGAVLDEVTIVVSCRKQVTNFDDMWMNHQSKFGTQRGSYLIFNKARTSYDSDIPFEVQDHDNYHDSVYGHHDVHEMQNNIQQDNMLLLKLIYEGCTKVGISNKQDRVVKDSLNSELARYKELVGEYEKRAKFELTEREQKIDEQMRIIISDRNRKETSLKSELHTVQMQLRSILDQYKSKTEEVTILKKDFKQTEDKYLEEFLDMKKLKDKVEDRLYKQDQSVQTVHMLCRPNPFYDEKKKVAIGYKNPLCLTRAKQVQSALYNGTEIVMTNHKPAVVHDSEETLEIAELTRKRMYEKMKSPLCIQNKVKFAPPDYSKENYLAIFAPQRDLTPEQIFWAKDENDRKKVEASVLKPLSTPTVRGGPEYWSTSVVDKQCAEIERKNLLIAYENLIANCLSNQLLFAVEQSRCLDLEAEISKLQNENQKDVNDEMIRGFNKLEMEYLNLQLKYQHLQENFRNNKSQTSQDVPEFDSFFKINNLEAQLQEKDNREIEKSQKAIQGSDMTLLRLRELTLEEARIVKPLDNALNYACQYTKLSQELLEYVIGTCPKSLNERDNKAASTPITRKKQVTFNDKPGISSSNTQKHEEHQKV
ncbi:hypothetical protein Tco_0474020 [Tanacetum coccineum]